VLEHLPTMADAVTVLERLARASCDFLFIRHPSFEDITYLARYGLKFSWTDWTGHRNPMTIGDFQRVFADLGWSEYAIVPHMAYADSSHGSVLRLDAPVDTQRHDAHAHGPKPLVLFDRPVYGKYDIFVRLDRGLSQPRWHAITRLDGWQARWEW
jgi:hypothetical protein